MRPLPTASEVVTPGPSQTSKRGGYSAMLIFIVIVPHGRGWQGLRRAPGGARGSKRKKEARKVCDLPVSQASELFAPLLRAHNASSILRPVGHRHPLATRRQIKNFISAIGHNTPAVLQGGIDSHGALALVWNGCAYKTPGIPCLRRGEASCSPR